MTSSQPQYLLEDDKFGEKLIISFLQVIPDLLCMSDVQGSMSKSRSRIVSRECASEQVLSPSPLFCLIYRMIDADVYIYRRRTLIIIQALNTENS